MQGLRLAKIRRQPRLLISSPHFLCLVSETRFFAWPSDSGAFKLCSVIPNSSGPSFGKAVRKCAQVRPEPFPVDLSRSQLLGSTPKG